MRKHDVSPSTTPGWGLKERLDSPLITRSGIFWARLIQFFLSAWPHHEGEVMKRGETALHHRVIPLPIALWLRTQSPNSRELYLLCTFS